MWSPTRVFAVMGTVLQVSQKHGLWVMVCKSIFISNNDLFSKPR